LDKNTDESYYLFEQACSQCLNLILIALLTETNNVIQSKKDAQILYIKNIELLVKLILIIGPPIRLFQMFEKTLDIVIKSIDKKVKSKFAIPESLRNDVGESLKTESDILKIQFQIGRDLHENFASLETIRK
jgi:hypothetical protein